MAKATQKPLKGVAQVKDLVALLLKEDQDADIALTMFEITGHLNSFGSIVRGTYKTGCSSEQPGSERKFVGVETDASAGTLADEEDDVHEDK